MRRPLALLLLNILAFLLLVLISINISQRESYASSIGFSFSSILLPLLKYQVLQNGKTELVSPPTLDWVQLIVLVLLVTDAYYLVKHFSSKK